MNKKVSNIVAFASVLALGLGMSAYAMAQSDTAQGAGGSNGIHEPGTGIEDPELKAEGQGTGQGQQGAGTAGEGVSGTGTQAQEQNKVQNQGEETQLQNQEQEQNEVGAGAGSAMAQQRKSRVANAVQEMLGVAERNGGIGEQVRAVAQAQEQNHEQVEASVVKAEERGGFAKFLIGPNYGEINKAKKLLEQNRTQVQELNQVMDQLTNEGDQQVLAQQIAVLEANGLEMEEVLNDLEGGFSLLGWMFKMFSN